MPSDAQLESAVVSAASNSIRIRAPDIVYPSGICARDYGRGSDGAQISSPFTNFRRAEIGGAVYLAGMGRYEGLLTQYRACSPTAKGGVIVART